MVSGDPENLLKTLSIRHDSAVLRALAAFSGLIQVLCLGFLTYERSDCDFRRTENSMNKVSNVCVTVTLMIVPVMLVSAQKTTAEQKLQQAPKARPSGSQGR